MVVLDTHAWIWWNDDPGRLSGPAREAIEAAETIGIAAISCWEAAMLALSGRLGFEPEISRWVRLALSRHGVAGLPLTPKVAVDAALLERHGFASDPADRMIYATAVDVAAPLVTRDARIRAYDPRRTIW
jgi:PIN domain nuclease of toxin-antitoxin system